MARTAAFYTDAALTALNAGFTSKADAQRASADINRAYDLHKCAIRDGLLADRTIANWNDLYWGIPDYPHNWKPRHSEAFAAWADEVAAIEKLVDLRAAVKAAPIVPPAPNAEKARVEAITTSIRDLLTRRGEQYNRALRLAEVFGGLPVTANVHLVTNEHGTTFLRAFYYLAGEFTPLNVILAAADKLEREAA